MPDVTEEVATATFKNSSTTIIASISPVLDALLMEDSGFKEKQIDFNESFGFFNRNKLSDYSYNIDLLYY